MRCNATWRQSVNSACDTLAEGGNMERVEHQVHNKSNSENFNLALIFRKQICWRLKFVLGLKNACGQ